MLQKIIIVLLFVGVQLWAKAHPNGHYHAGDGTVFSEWRLKNGQMLTGNFSSGKGNYFIIEQEEGRLIKVCADSLTFQYKALAQLEIEKFVNVNKTLTTQIVLEKRINYANVFASILLLLVVVLLAYQLVKQLLSNKAIQRSGWQFMAMATLLMLSLYACKKTAENISTTIPKSVPSTMDLVFTPYKPMVSTSWDQNYFYVSGNGFPNHNMMVGITSWQQQVPAPQAYTGANSWSIPLQPEYAVTPISTRTNFMKGAVAIAANGIPIFNALNNRGDDAYLVGELDNWGGHCGRADDYHYHAAPLHLNSTNPSLPIAYALDGFAIYGNKEPDGATMQPLDTCHGHIYNNGVYHYHGTTTYPYTVGAMKGKVTIDPSTPAPENQILPQAFASPFRPPGTPLNGASIIAFAPTGTNAYLLTYRRGTKTGTLAYNWNSSNRYTFTHTDTAGVVTVNNYVR